MLTKYGKTITYVNNKNEIHQEETNRDSYYAFKVQSDKSDDLGNSNNRKTTYIIRGIKKDDLINYQDMFPTNVRICAFDDVINSFDLSFSNFPLGHYHIGPDTVAEDNLLTNLTQIYKKVLNKTQENISYTNPSIISITKTVLNNTSDDISIKSIFLYSYPYGKHSQSEGSDTRAFLIDYEELDDAITLHPGDKLTFTLLIR